MCYFKTNTRMYTIKPCSISCIRQYLFGHELDKSLNDIARLVDKFTVLNTKEKFIQYLIKCGRSNAHAAGEGRGGLRSNE